MLEPVRNGIQKTNIRDICSKCGISLGAFYLFYESKEYLFVETAKKAVKRLASIIDRNMPAGKPTKQDLAKAFKIMAKNREINMAFVALITLKLNFHISGAYCEKAYELIVDSTIDRLFD